jgi:transglutaminase-like putative cysteine protease
LSFPTYPALTSDNAQKNFISVNEEGSGGEIVYTPYFPLFNNFENMVYGNDSVILYKNNANYHRNEKAAYGIYSYSLGDITKALDKTSESRNSNQYKSIENLERQYRESAYTYYTQIDGNTRNLLKEYTKSQHFEQISDRKALTDAVSQFVKKSASYNANTPSTPDGKDYLRYFLLESKQGYCMHFATEATLIFRMLGIPARYVSGYSININSDQVGKWTSATDKNAHAWTEVYFDGIGWIPVDVTPVESRSGLTSSTGSNSGISNNPGTSGNTSSKPPQSSSVSTSNTVTAPGSSDTSSETMPPKERTNLIVWIIPTAVLVILIFIIVRRKYLINKRKKAFVQANANKAVISAWNYIEKLKVYRVDPDKSIYYTAQKAVFSKHTLSKDERKKVVGFAEEKAKELDNNLGFFRKIVFRYIKGLY